MNITATDNNINSIVSSYIERTLSLQTSVTELRRKALTEFQRAGLPNNKSEEYKYTPITRALEKNFKFSSTHSTIEEVDPQNFLLPSFDAYVVVLINGIFSPQHSTINSSSSCIVLPIEEAVSKHSDVVLKHLAKYADDKADAFTAWNSATWSSGVFIFVPDNTVVQKPIVIYNIHDANTQEVISAVRNLIVVGTSSELTVLEKFDSRGPYNSFSTVVTEGVIAANAQLNLYSIQNDSGNRYQYGLTQIQQANSSRVNTYTFTLNGKLIRNNLNLALDGEGIESHMYGLYLLGGDTVADNHTVADHKQAHSFSNELYKGIMDDNSKGVFNGKIYVRPQAQKTNAFQANRNVLLSDKASINTKPQLEIWADDVKCSHGCTSGQLDEEALFYLRTRGISKETARAMMLYAFAAELFETIKHPQIREFVDNLVSERLHKNF